MSLLETKYICDEKEFYDLKEDWNRLLQQSQSDTPFLTFEWAYAWWQSMKAANRSLFILVFFKESKMVGIAPLAILHSKKYGFLSLKKVEFMGYEIANGEYLDFITAPGMESEVSEGVVNFLIKNFKLWDVLELQPWFESAISLFYFKKLCDQHGLKTFLFLRSICPIVSLPKNWEEFRQSLSKSLRKKSEYNFRRLYKENQTTLSCWDSKQEIREKLPEFFEMHQKKWNAEGEPGTFADPRKCEFYKELSDQFFDNNWLHVCRLEINQQPVSYLYGIRYNNCFYDLQSAYDLNWQARSVGTVLLYHSLQNCVTNGIDFYDFLRGEEKYKYQWGAQPRRNLRLLIFKTGLLHFIFKVTRRKKIKEQVSIPT